MAKPEELKRLGEKMAQDFTESGVPLNISLEKIASTYGLNPDQIHRVAEAANIQTHLSLMKTASSEEAYITFDVADPTKYKAKETSLKKSAESNLSDYSLSPDVSFFELQKVAELAEPQTPISQNQLYVDSAQKVANLNKAKNDAMDTY